MRTYVGAIVVWLMSCFFSTCTICAVDGGSIRELFNDVRGVLEPLSSTLNNEYVDVHSTGSQPQEEQQPHAFNVACGEQKSLPYYIVQMLREDLDEEIHAGTVELPQLFRQLFHKRLEQQRRIARIKALFILYNRIMQSPYKDMIIQHIQEAPASK